MKGVDVSYCQDSLDWQDLKDNGEVGFGIARIGRRGDTGNLYIDTSFIDHFTSMLAAGLDVGVYFYTKATTEAQVIEDAKWIIDTLNTNFPDAKLIKGIWYDVEDVDTTGTLDPDSITALCSKFICTMNDAGYQNVGIYSGYKWFVAEHRILHEQFADYVPLWVAQYNSECDFTDPKVKLWQNTDQFLGMNLDGNKEVSF